MIADVVYRKSAAQFYPVSVVAQKSLTFLKYVAYSDHGISAH